MPAVCVSRSLTVDRTLGGAIRLVPTPFSFFVLTVRLLEGRDPLAGTVIHRELAFLHELQDGDAGQRLGLRGDAELGVHGHLAAGLLVGPAHRALIHRFAVAQHQRDDAGDAAVIDIGIEQRVDARQALDREAIAQRVGLRRQRGESDERAQSGNGCQGNLLRHAGPPRAGDGRRVAEA